MGHRLSKIYTRTGDDGSTGLADGSRLPKNALRIGAIGDVDELNCHIGVLIEQLEPEDPLATGLRSIQHHLFDLGGELAIPGSRQLQESHIRWLEEQLDGYNAGLPPLKDFILPGGSPAAAQCHLARAVCRRAERSLVSLGQEEELSPVSRQYLNRLSDLLFVLARVLARRSGAREILWEPGRHGPERNHDR